MCDDSPDPHSTDSAAGGSGDLDDLVARYLPRLHAYVRLNMSGSLRAHEASIDVVQSVCREVLEERERFVFAGEGPFLGWLLTTAMNKLRERARYRGRQKRDARRETPEESVDPGLFASLLTPSRDAMASEEIERLERALERLPEDHREIVILARIVGLPHAQIAEQMGRTVSSIRNLLGRALTQLVREIERSR